MLVSARNRCWPSFSSLELIFKNVHSRQPANQNGKLVKHLRTDIAEKEGVDLLAAASPDSALIQGYAPPFWRQGARLPWILAPVLLLAAAGCREKSAKVAPGQHLDFNQDVQPILASNCF